MEKLIIENVLLFSDRIIALVFAVLFGVIVSAINKYIAEDRLKERLKRVTDIAHQTVVAVNSEVVDDLKESGEFSKAEAKKAFNAALIKLNDQMSPVLTEALEETFGDVDEYLENLIETEVEKAKEKL